MALVWIRPRLLSMYQRLQQPFLLANYLLYVLEIFLFLTNTSTNNVSNWWYADTSQFSTNGNSVYTFADPGMIDIKLIINDGRCFDSTIQSFSVNALPNLVPDVMHETCPQSEDGAINITANGGVAPFIFTWSTLQNTKDISNLTGGTYMLTARDPDGCEITETFVVNTLGGLTADFASAQTPNGIQFTDMSDTTATRWSWDFGDGQTSSSQSPAHSYAFNGRYVVCLVASDRFGCTDTTCDTLDVATAIDDLIAGKLNIYPNPANDQVFIDVSELTGQAFELKLFDGVGRLILSKKETAKEEMSLDISHLYPAIYFLVIESKDGKLSSKLLKK